MNDTIDYQHKPALLNAKTKFELLKSIPDSQWDNVPVDNVDVQVYTDCNQISTIRVIKELDSTKTNLGSFQASLSNIGLRSICKVVFVFSFDLFSLILHDNLLGCPWLQNMKLLDQPSSNLNLIQASIALDKFTSK
jgi:hypothetical protein